MKKNLDNRDVFFCMDCNEKQLFDLEGNIKICTMCMAKSSYRAEFRKRWSKLNYHPDLTDSTPYNRVSDENTMNLYNDIATILPQLSVKERQVIELLWEGKTQYQVAQIMDIGQPRVARYLSRARVKIGKYLQGD